MGQAFRWNWAVCLFHLVLVEVNHWSSSGWLHRGLKGKAHWERDFSGLWLGWPHTNGACFRRQTEPLSSGLESLTLPCGSKYSQAVPIVSLYFRGSQRWAKFVYVIWVSPCVSFPPENFLQLFVFISWGCFFSGSSSNKTKKGTESSRSVGWESLCFSSHLDPLLSIFLFLPACAFKMALLCSDFIGRQIHPFGAGLITPPVLQQPPYLVFIAPCFTITKLCKICYLIAFTFMSSLA